MARDSFRIWLRSWSDSCRWRSSLFRISSMSIGFIVINHPDREVPNRVCLRYGYRSRRSEGETGFGCLYRQTATLEPRVSFVSSRSEWCCRWRLEGHIPEELRESIETRTSPDPVSRSWPK